jgi:hypothetical protein
MGCCRVFSKIGREPIECPCVRQCEPRFKAYELRRCLWNRCNQEYLSDEALVRHVEQDHRLVPLPFRDDDRLKVRTCRWDGCSKVVTGLDPFFEHVIREHVSLNPEYCCTKCPLLFLRKDWLDAHKAHEHKLGR